MSESHVTVRMYSRGRHCSADFLSDGVYKAGAVKIIEFQHCCFAVLFVVVVDYVCYIMFVCFY